MPRIKLPPPEYNPGFAGAGELAGHIAGAPEVPSAFAPHLQQTEAEQRGHLADLWGKTKEIPEESDAQRRAEMERFRLERDRQERYRQERDRQEARTSAEAQSSGWNEPFGGHTGAERIDAVAEATNWSSDVVDRIHGTRERIESWGAGPVELVEVSGKNIDEVPGELVFSVPDGGHYSVEWESDAVTYLAPGEYGGQMSTDDVLSRSMPTRARESNEAALFIME